MDIPDRIALKGSLILLILFFLMCTTGCVEEKEEKTPLRVVAAGSLLLPFQAIEKRFETENPDVDLLVEGHGSIQAIRQVTDLNRSFDVVAVADESLIPALMYQPMPGSDKNWVNNFTRFGTTEMVLLYTNNSAYADEINESNWYKILMRDDVRFGCANPILDAAGYRAIMVLALADRYYGRKDILDGVYTGQFSPAIPVKTNGDITRVSLPDVLKPDGLKVTMRDGSIFLLSLLQSGGVDYAIEYKCVAEGSKLPYVRLPDPINLGEGDYQDYYRSAVVDLNFQRFSTINQTRTGSQIIYAACIPANSKNPDLAAEFIRDLSEDNSAISGMPDPV